MYKFLIYPYNVAIILLVALFFSLFELSNFYKPPFFLDIIFVFIIIFFYCIQYRFIKPMLMRDLQEYTCNEKIYIKYLVFSFFGFILEFILYGFPIFSDSGRDGFAGIPILHVVFYSCTMLSILYSALYSSKKDLLLCLTAAMLLSVLMLSRQMMMIAFILTLISMAFRYDLSKKKFLKIILYTIFILFIFGIVGNIRQKLAGDYVDQFIIVFGGANEKGEMLGDIAFWIWLYIASPMYNLIVNFDSYYLVGDRCNTSVYAGTCSGHFLTDVLLPETFVKYLGIEKFKIDLEMQYLNVGTAFASAARILGLPGVILQVILQGLFFYFGYLLTPSRLKSAFVVYFSALSFFMIFDNLFIKGEFFFVFLIIFLSRYNLVLKKK